MEPGSYETDTSGMARAHGMVEDALAAALRYVIEASVPRRIAAVASFCENVLEYVHVHHGAEDDLLYPKLVKRSADERESIDRIWSRHQLLHAPMEAVTDTIDKWRTDPNDTTTGALCDSLSCILQVLTPHCREEEAIVVPLASRYVSHAEWVEMLPHETRNYRGDKPWLMLGLALERADEVRREALLALLPGVRRSLWTDEWSPTFQAFIADVRG